MRKTTWLVLVSLFTAFASNAMAASVGLEWNANTEPDLTGYKVYFATRTLLGTTTSQAAGDPTITKVASITTSTVVTNLMYQTSYFFRVSAMNASGMESAFNVNFSSQNVEVSTYLIFNVAIVSPVAGSTFAAPANLTIAANANILGGSVTRVDFFRNGVFIASSAVAPYAVSWNNVSSGTYSMSARAYDDQGSSVASSAVSVNVVSVNAAPAVSVTSPLNGVVFNAPANLSLAANASDADGSITRVEFLANGVLVASSSIAPYGATWNNVSSGTYLLSARAFDNQGSSATSPSVSITVNAPAYSASTDWPQLQHDPQHSGRTSVAYDPNRIAANKTAKWVWVDETHITPNFVSQANAKINYPNPRRVILAGTIQPIVAQNRVYFGAANGEFYALDGSNGATVWKKQLGGAVLHTAAFDSGVIVTGSMDGKIYAFDAANGTPKWTYQTGKGISVAPIIDNGTVYAGSRDGYFYAVNLADGSLRWRYQTLAASAGDPFTGAPILQTAASDGNTIYFGAENMYFYALDAISGAEKWRRKLGGMSFQYTWPVVYNNFVMTHVAVSYGKSEYVMENELDALPAISTATGETRLAYANRIWPQERASIQNFIAANPAYRNFYAMNALTGNDQFASEIPMGRVGGFGYPNMAPILDNQNRILTYWRTRSSTFLTGITFGTKYIPDIGALDPNTGDRVALTPNSGQNCELDNNFMLTVGGNILYMNNHMRGAFSINLTNGSAVRLTSINANWDGANFRGWGNKMIWWGNDADAAGTTDMPFPSAHRSPQGESGVVIANINGTPSMILQESGHYQINFGCLAVLQ